jgi:hypothetical protein
MTHGFSPFNPDITHCNPVVASNPVILSEAKNPLPASACNGLARSFHYVLVSTVKSDRTNSRESAEKKLPGISL